MFDHKDIREYKSLTKIVNQTEVSIVGSLEGEKARMRRRSIIRTGTKRSKNGGGGKGGRTSGSRTREIETVSNIITMTDPTL